MRSTSSKKKPRLVTESELQIWAQQFSKKLKWGDWVLLEGPLGAGKSTLARFLIQQFVPQSEAGRGSPSFPIMHEYETTKGKLIHLDCYRLKSERDAQNAGIPEYFEENDCLLLVEWSSLFPQLFVPGIRFQFGKNKIYRIHLEFCDDPKMRSLKVGEES